MKKRNRLWLLVLLGSYWHGLLAQNPIPNTDYPSYSVVKNHILTQYDLPDLPDFNETYNLMKNATGVYLTEQTYHFEGPAHYRLAKKYLVWSAASRSFQPLRFSKARKSDITAPRFASIDTFHFNIFPFWGYNGWQKDIIEALKPWAEKSQLSATMWYVYGRAHSELAEGMLLNKREYSDTSVYFHINPLEPRLSAAQAAQYRQVMDKAISSYARCAELDPNFNTLVGTIRTKYCNEILDAYVNLEIFGDPDAANILKPDLYDGFWEEFAQNMLLNAPPNAVIVTQGDMNLYVPIYFQKVKNWRPDVVILNEALLNLPEYVAYVHKRKGVAMTLPLSFFNDKNSLFVRIEDDDNSEEVVHIGPALRKIMANTDNSVALRDKSIVWPTRDNEAVLRLDNYIMRSQIAVLDMLYSAPLRPLCYLSMSDFGQCQYFMPYMLSKGFLHVVTPQLQSESPISHSFDLVCDSLEMAHLLSNKYVFNDKSAINAEKETVVLDYLRQFYQLANTQSAHDPEKAKATLARFSTLFNSRRWPVSLAYRSVIFAQMAIGDKKAAEKTLALLRQKMVAEKNMGMLQELDKLAAFIKKQ